MKKIFKILFPSLFVIILVFIFSNFYQVEWMRVYISSAIFLIIQICLYIKNPRALNKTWRGLSFWGTFNALSIAIVEEYYYDEILSLISGSMFLWYLFFVIVPYAYNEK